MPEILLAYGFQRAIRHYGGNGGFECRDVRLQPRFTGHDDVGRVVTFKPQRGRCEPLGISQLVDEVNTRFFGYEHRVDAVDGQFVKVLLVGGHFEFLDPLIGVEIRVVLIPGADADPEPVKVFPLLDVSGVSLVEIEHFGDIWRDRRFKVGDVRLPLGTVEKPDEQIRLPAFQLGQATLERQIVVAGRQVRLPKHGLKNVDKNTSGGTTFEHPVRGALGARHDGDIAFLSSPHVGSQPEDRREDSDG